MVDHDKRKSKSMEELDGISSNTPVTIKGNRSLKNNVSPIGSLSPKYAFACDWEIITDFGAVSELSIEPLSSFTGNTLKNELSTKSIS